jgi:hypothetical protein
MQIVPDLHGLNEQYRRARGTQRTFCYDPDAWWLIRAESSAIEMKKRHEREVPAGSDEPPPPKRRLGRPQGSKNKCPGKPRKKRKAVSSNGRVLICATEKKLSFR